jgi:tetratricopeptide (TPR) repeat protein
MSRRRRFFVQCVTSIVSAAGLTACALVEIPFTSGSTPSSQHEAGDVETVAADLIASGQNDAAKQLLVQATSGSRRPAARLYYLLGIVHDREGSTADAIAAYSNAIGEDRDYVDAFFGRAMAHSKVGDNDAAIRDLRAALALRPLHLDSTLALATIQMRRSDTAPPDLRRPMLEEAAGLFFAASLANSDNAEVHLGLGQARRRQERFDDSVRALRKSISLRPDSATAHGELGLAQFGKGDFDNAAVAFLRAIDIDKDDEEYHLNLAVAYARKGLVSEAEIVLRSAAAGKKSRRLHDELARLYMRTGQFSRAVATYLTILSFDALKTSDLVDLAYAHQQLGDPRTARTYYGQALERDANLVDALVGLGNVARALGVHDEAIRHYTAAMAKAATNPAIEAGISAALGRVYLEQKDLGKAVDFARRAVSRAPNVAEHHLLLARIYIAADRFTEANSAIEAALRIAPAFASARRLQGENFERLGKRREAVEAYEKYLETIGKQDDGSEIAARIRKLQGRR